MFNWFSVRRGTSTSFIWFEFKFTTIWSSWKLFEVRFRFWNEASIFQFRWEKKTKSHLVFENILVVRCATTQQTFSKFQENSRWFSVDKHRSVRVEIRTKSDFQLLSERKNRLKTNFHWTKDFREEQFRSGNFKKMFQSMKKRQTQEWRTNDRSSTEKCFVSIKFSSLMSSFSRRNSLINDFLSSEMIKIPKWSSFFVKIQMNDVFNTNEYRDSAIFSSFVSIFDWTWKRIRISRSKKVF